MNRITLGKTGLVIEKNGFGCLPIQRISEQDAVYLLHKAYDGGINFFDTARAYSDSEQKVGAAFSTMRDKIVLATKTGAQTAEEFWKDLETSLRTLKTDYIDLYLLHWPRSVEKNIAAYKVMEKYYRAGTLRAIGVSNYKEHHLEELMAETEIVPAVNQVELHPDFDQHELKAFCDARGIKLEAWSPLGGQGSDLMQNKVLVSLAEKHGRTPAQIIIRWNIQRGVIVIPKSVHKERIVSNFNVFDFELSKEDMELIGTLEAGRRYRADPDHFEYTR